MAPPRTRGQSAAASRYTAMAAAAGKSPTYNSQISRSQAIKQVQARQTQSDESLSGVPSPVAAILSGIGTAMRAKVIKELEAGGTPVYERGMMMGVRTLDGKYFGRNLTVPEVRGAGAEEADPRLLMEGPTSADAGGPDAGGPDAGGPDAGGLATVKRTEFVKKMEEENRRRRLAGLRRLGSRSLLSGDRFTADTLGAS
jgi:hypothetical protein